MSTQPVLVLLVKAGNIKIIILITISWKSHEIPGGVGLLPLKKLNIGIAFRGSFSFGLIDKEEDCKQKNQDDGYSDIPRPSTSWCCRKRANAALSEHLATQNSNSGTLFLLIWMPFYSELKSRSFNEKPRVCLRFFCVALNFLAFWNLTGCAWWVFGGA